MYIFRGKEHSPLCIRAIHATNGVDNTKERYWRLQRLNSHDCHEISAVRVVLTLARAGGGGVVTTPPLRFFRNSV